MKLLTIDTHHCMDFLNFESLKPSLIDLSVEPTVVHRIEEHKPPGKKLIVTIRVPVLKNKTKLQSTEQLMLLPTVQECVEFNKCESPNSFCFDFVEGSYVIHKEEINY